jgi:hypothetical protein
LGDKVDKEIIKSIKEGNNKNDEAHKKAVQRDGMVKKLGKEARKATFKCDYRRCEKKFTTKFSL